MSFTCLPALSKIQSDELNYSGRLAIGCEDVEDAEVAAVADADEIFFGSFSTARFRNDRLMMSFHPYCPEARLH